MKVVATQVTNTKDGHNKFYRVYVFGATEVRHWGAIGSRGHSKKTLHSGPVSASMSALRKIDEEIIKGYEEHEVREFDIAYSSSSEVTLDELMRGWIESIGWKKRQRTPTTESSYQQVLWDMETV